VVIKPASDPARAPAGGIRFRILGPLEAWDGRGWTRVSAAKWRALLAVLLLHRGQPVGSARLIDELWGEHPPASAANLLSVYVHRLRRLTGDPGGAVLATRPPGYQAVLAPGELDAGRFTGLAGQARQALAAGDPGRAAALAAEALAWWRGPALADVPPTPLVAAEAQRLAEARLQALALKAEADLGCGRDAQVVPELRRLLADHPLREELWALLLRALAGAGRQAEALAAYGEARRVIAEELGVDPGAPLQRLYQQILNADAAGLPTPAGGSAGRAGQAGLGLAAPPGRTARPPGWTAPPPAPKPAQLPSGIADFTGRAAAVDQVCRVLAGHGEPSALPVLVIVGSGGLGKTTLAVHAAHRVAGRFPDGQLYASLGGAAQPLEPAEVLGRFLRALGADPARIPVDAEERAAQYRSRLAGQRVLVLLDDARDAAQVAPLLAGSGTCAVLVTSRSRLPELASAAVLDLGVLPPGEARELFGRVAGEDRVRAEPEATGQVLAACAGLPLAIRIAGARLAARGGWSVSYLAGRLAGERQRLDELRAGNLAVRASFEVSFASLPRPPGPQALDPARAFRLLGLWTGPAIGLPAVAALAGEPEPAVAAALDVLVDAHLLQAPAPEVYRFHELLRVYAGAQAEAEEPLAARRAAVTRLLTWYLHTAEAAARVISPQHARVPLSPPPPAVRPLEFAALEEALAWCETWRPGLAAATRLAADFGLHELAWKLPAAAMSFYYRRSHWGDWAATHQAGLASARALGDRLAEAWMLNNLGMAYGVQRQPEAIGCFERALAISREIGDSRGEARAANNLANAYFDLGRFREARTAAKASLAVQRRAGNRYGEGIAQGILGGSCRDLGQHREAVRHLRAALAIFRELGDRRTEADSLSDLGEAYLGTGRAEEALTALRQSLRIWRDVGDRLGEAAARYRLGLAEHRAGNAAQARRLVSQAASLFQDLGDQAQAVQAREWLATTFGGSPGPGDPAPGTLPVAAANPATGQAPEGKDTSWVTRKPLPSSQPARSRTR
jgi:DNA-binding SARP family transcriptional activator/tetratricopeptide (TPR) repeat protein